jgi:hypothetical protein
MAEAERYELSVGHLSEGNLRLYRRLGYREFGEHTVSPRLRVIHMRKSRQSKTLDWFSVQNSRPGNVCEVRRPTSVAYQPRLPDSCFADDRALLSPGSSRVSPR